MQYTVVVVKTSTRLMYASIGELEAAANASRGGVGMRTGNESMASASASTSSTSYSKSNCKSGNNAYGLAVATDAYHYADPLSAPMPMPRTRPPEPDSYYDTYLPDIAEPPSPHAMELTISVALADPPRALQPEPDARAPAAAVRASSRAGGAGAGAGAGGGAEAEKSHATGDRNRNRRPDPDPDPDPIHRSQVHPQSPALQLPLVYITDRYARFSHAHGGSYILFTKFVKKKTMLLMLYLLWTNTNIIWNSLTKCCFIALHDTY